MSVCVCLREIVCVCVFEESCVCVWFISKDFILGSRDDFRRLS